MVPLPAQGHLNQLLRLSRLISSYGIPVHYVGTTSHSRQANLRIHGWDPLAATNIHFHEFPTPSFLSPPPNPNVSFPSHIMPLFYALLRLREPVGALLRSLSTASKRVLVIHDSLMASVVQDVPSTPNAESYSSESVSAFFISFCVTSEFMEFIQTQQQHGSFNSGSLYNTCKSIEDPYLDMLAEDQINGTKKQWTIGPFHPVEISKDEVHYVGTTTHTRQAKLRVHGWDPLSVNNIHFHELPSPSFLSPPQDPNVSFPSHIVPLLYASSKLRDPVATLLQALSTTTKRVVVIHDSLMASLVQDIPSISNTESYSFHSVSAFSSCLFLSVLGRPVSIGQDILKEAPSMESCVTSQLIEFSQTQQEHKNFNSGTLYNTCKVIEDPYLDILAENQTAGTKKQWAIGPFNPVEIWKNTNSSTRHPCLEWLDKQDWACRHEIVTSLLVENAVKKLMASTEGDEIRKRAADLGGSIRQSAEDGGVTRMELDSFISHIAR
ncbi:unnamed protein product [Ilex paraguariensis]|uniref:Glycosyltransferase N-terminal domain-containing protein n=1 Tax=Ilex paraguariensis TaxID=185542 RepID=A0ABC8RJK2_9AQUA